MKLKVTRRKRLVAMPFQMPEGRTYLATRRSKAGRREALYEAIRDTWSFLHPNGGAEDFMADLKRRYPAPQYFLEANCQTLERTGLPRMDAFYYSLIPSLARTCLSQQWGPKPRLDRLDRMGEYMKTLYVGIHVERSYLVMLDGRGRLIRAALLQSGALDGTPFYLDQVLAVALREEPRFLVLVHNHPGGTKRPSKEDLACTLRTINAFLPLQIPLLDHVIVAGSEVVSIRQLGLLPAMLWQYSLPGSRIVKHWLDGET